MPDTYRELRDALNKLSDSQLDCNLTVFDPNDEEYYPVSLKLTIENDTDVLDPGHPVLGITYK